MGEFLDKIIALLTAYFMQKQKYEWRFYNLIGNEPNKQLKVANSIEYEFINSGTTLVKINDRLTLYPAWMQYEPSRVKFVCNKNEVDVGVYEYDFRPLTNADQTGGFTFGATDYYYTSKAFDVAASPYVAVNSLQVIVKVVSRA